MPLLNLTSAIQKRTTRAFVLLVSLLFSACAIQQSPRHSLQNLPPALQLKHHLLTQTLSDITAWQLSGALSIRTASDSVSAFANWQQQTPTCYDITLTGPAGSGSIKIEALGKQITLKTANGKRYRATSAEALLKSTIGWQLPISQLVYWIRGLVAPGSIAQQQFNDHGVIQFLLQDGWEIEYQRFTALNAGLILPSKLQLTRSDRTLKIKILINSWVIPARHRVK